MSNSAGWYREKEELAVVPAKAGIQKRTRFANWTPAFAGMTTSDIISRYQ